MSDKTNEIVASNLVAAVISVLENHNYGNNNFNPTKDDISELKNETLTATISNVEYVYDKIKNRPYFNEK